MNEWTAEFPIEPTSKGRPKASFVNGRITMRTPLKTRQAEEELQLWILSSKPHHFRNAALWLELEFTIKRPKRSTPAEHPYPTVGKDIDNMSKLVMDAANGLLWDDDKQIVDLMVRKRYGKQPSVRITVGRMEEL